MRGRPGKRARREHRQAGERARLMAELARVDEELRKSKET
jgi:hypothetical protein